MRDEDGKQARVGNKQIRKNEAPEGKKFFIFPGRYFPD